MLGMHISSLHACSVHASIPDTYAQHGLTALFKSGIFTLMLSNELTCKELMRAQHANSVSDAYAQGGGGGSSANASVPDSYAQGTHQSLMRMFSMF
jgi:hypothetical protein